MRTKATWLSVMLATLAISACGGETLDDAVQDSALRAAAKDVATSAAVKGKTDAASVKAREAAEKKASDAANAALSNVDTGPAATCELTFGMEINADSYGNCLFAVWRGGEVIGYGYNLCYKDVALVINIGGRDFKAVGQAQQLANGHIVAKARVYGHDHAGRLAYELTNADKSGIREGKGEISLDCSTSVSPEPVPKPAPGAVSTKPSDKEEDKPSTAVNLKDEAYKKASSK